MMTTTTAARRCLAMVYMALSIAIIPLLGGCEDIASADDIPYVERIVVRGKLEVWKPIDSILLTRTLPLVTDYDPLDAAITDADATITTNGTRYRLIHIGAGFYRAPELIVQPGRTYTLDVSWKDKRVTGSTVAPIPASIDSVIVNKVRVNTYNGPDTVVVPTAIFRPRGQQVYLLSYAYVWMFNGGITTTIVNLNGEQRIVRSSDTALDGRIHLRGETPEYYSYGESGNVISVTVQLHGYDYPFYDYYQTARTGRGDDDIFGFSGGNTTRWNVSGDGFGMFIASWTADTTVQVN